MAAQDRDPDVLSIPEAARLSGYSDGGLRKRIHSGEDAALAIVIRFGATARPRVSLPRLCRFVHGAEADALIPEWRQRVAGWRAATRAELSA